MNLLNGDEPAHNFLPSKLRGKKRFICYLRVIAYSHVYQLAQPASGMLWNITQEFSSPTVSHEWSWNWENIFVIKKCGDINPFLGRFPTPMTYHWNTWFWWFMLGFSIRGASSVPPATVIPVGRGCLHHRLHHCWNLERTFPVRARTVLLILMSFERKVYWMMLTFPADTLITASSFSEEVCLKDSDNFERFSLLVSLVYSPFCLIELSGIKTIFNSLD